jgi:signal transduction histidine kinase
VDGRQAPRPDGESVRPGPDEAPAHEQRRWDVHPPRPSVPRSFQSRLTFAFVAIVAVTLGLISPVIINRLDDYFRQQEEQGLRLHAYATAEVLARWITDEVATGAVVASVDGKSQLNPEVVAMLRDRGILQLAANDIAQADVTVTFGAAYSDATGVLVPSPDPSLTYTAMFTRAPDRGQARDAAIAPATQLLARPTPAPWGLEVQLSNPFTGRASTLAAITGLLLIMALVAVAVAILVASFVAHRFATPVMRLTEASRRVAEGDLTARVNTESESGTVELQALSEQFNTMAGRLEQSVEIIRRDRDRSRDFLADVSHELRTPIAAMHTFIELLQGPAGTDPAARLEFLDSSAAQLDRLDWLAQNLLELSKLDSGLVLLDLHPNDVRGTIESAVEQHLATAERKGIVMTTSLPDRPLRISHDAPRIGQVVGNLVANALKFTARGGRVHVAATREADGGVRIEVADTGVGIRPDELPRIFERFYRGTQANEARSTGSGLGLSIVKSIVDMHHGIIEVESRLGHGARFVVVLPRDPSAAAGAPGRHSADSHQKVDDSSPGAEHA